MDQELLWKLEQSHQKLKDLEEKLFIVVQQIIELKNFGESLEEIKTNEGKEILASLGKGVFVKSEIKDKKLFIDVGLGTLIRKDLGETQKVLRDQVLRLENMKVELESGMETLNQEVGTLIGQIENKD